MFKKSNVVLLAVCGLVSIPSHAGVYVGLQADNNRVSGDLTDACSDSQKYYERIKKSYSYGVVDCKNDNRSPQMFVGYRFNPIVAIELGYVDFGDVYLSEKTYDNVNMSNPKPDGYVLYYSEKRSGSGDATALSVLLGGDINESFGLYGRAGIYHWNVKSQISWSYPLKSYKGPSDSAKGDAYGWGVGTVYHIKKFDLFAEYRRVNNIGDEEETGENDIKTVSLGFRFNFN